MPWHSFFTRIRLTLICLLALWLQDCTEVMAEVPPLQDRPWNRDLIYFVMTDRFLDGDPANNQPENSDPSLYDPSQSDIARYHGGDFRGLEIAIRDGYFNDLGVTAIWLTPPVRNAWNSSFDLGGPKTGYHGYWAQDFLDIDPHLTSRTSLSGEPYSDDRDGRMQHYRDLVALAHSRNIKIVQDVVCNHVGPLFHYDTNGNGSFDVHEGYEWIMPYKNHGAYDSAVWSNEPQWNLLAPQPAGAVTVLGRTVPTTGILQNLDVYGRKGFSPDSLGKSDGEEVTCDFFSLRDFWTRGDSSHFDALVNEFVEIYSFYLQEIGVDGLRIDTVKHVHHEFWDRFTERLREKVGEQRSSKLLLFGEVYDGNPNGLGRYTYRSDFPEREDPCLDSLLNFQFCFNVRDYLRVKEVPFGSPGGLAGTIQAMNDAGEKPIYNPAKGVDGLSSRQKMVNFFENHDGINRFLVDRVSVQSHMLALGILFGFEGVPCLYYGSEVPLQDERGEIGRDAETGRMTYCYDGDVSLLDRAKLTKSYKLIKSLAETRQALPALYAGRMNPLWVDTESSEDDDGVFAFARYLEDGASLQTSESVVVVVNANPDGTSSAGTEGKLMRLMSHDNRPLVEPGQRLRRIDLSGDDDGPLIDIQWVDGIPQVQLAVEAESFNLFSVE